MKRKPNLRDFKKADEICKGFRAKVFFGYSGDGSEVDVEERHINIDLEEVSSVNVFWSLVFHELAHIWCWDNEKYITYHADSLSPKEMSKYIRRNGLKIEQYVDKIGERLMKDYFPDIPFMGCYESAGDVRWYRTWVKRNYPL